mmetsp:Transcript_51335/g.149300  ORF Transcript_51335/g.149300 Transcript_51335/m.149300 type:complete len:271 (+) Transcript_51335:511-1323(+)
MRKASWMRFRCSAGCSAPSVMACNAASARGSAQSSRASWSDKTPAMNGQASSLVDKGPRDAETIEARRLAQSRPRVCTANRASCPANASACNTFSGTAAAPWRSPHCSCAIAANADTAEEPCSPETWRAIRSSKCPRTVGSRSVFKLSATETASAAWKRSWRCGRRKRSINGGRAARTKSAEAGCTAARVSNQTLVKSVASGRLGFCSLAASMAKSPMKVSTDRSFVQYLARVPRTNEAGFSFSLCSQLHLGFALTCNPCSSRVKRGESW